MNRSVSPVSQPKTGKPGEIIFLAAMLLGIARLFPEALKLSGVLQGQWAGAGSLAQSLLIAMAVLILTLTISVWRQSPMDIGATVRYLFSRDAVLLLVTVIAYTFAMGQLGFVIATFAFLLSAMYLLDMHKPLQKVVIALATVGVVYAIFAMLFKVILP